MFPRILTVALFLIISYFGTAQITTTPELPIATKAATITFDSSKDSRLGYFTGDLYAHTGVIIDGITDWQYVIESWGNNTTQPKLTNKGGGIYELQITPNINTFYGVQSGEKVIKMAFVFRSADGSQQTNDLMVNVYEDGLVVEITDPIGSVILEKNVATTISARSSINSALKLLVNETLIAENSNTEIAGAYTFTAGGNYWIIAQATADGKTVFDSMEIFVREDVIIEPKPTSYKNGINYPTDQSAALVLYAPLKEFVFVLGDFNNWEVSSDFQMKKDGDYFWIDIPNLEKGKEYAFQYFIDGAIKVADPYTEKILDPWNDQYIAADVYPNLLPYPSGKTTGVTAVLQPGQEDYNWEVANFDVPEKNKLAIYELLIRDFTDKHTYKAVLENLDYLEDLRVNVLELMPVNEFEGNSSWGYNPSFYFAPDKYYGPKDELKKLIDECHKRGIAVVIDMVLNHSYGQSPFVQMYMDNWTITPENPWYNQQHNFQNTAAHWGFDFNHESLATKELVDSVSSFWMTEYKIDGFRFDFTKGFSNTVYDPLSWGSDYDAQRISNLKRMTNEIWKRNADAIVIFEHLAENSEETELANYGILLWGNMHGSYLQAARGNTSNSDLSWAVYSQRGWNEANLVSYPESHDEERIMYDIKTDGLANGDYNVKNQRTALKRIALNSLFHIPLPGPKMIWQFGERGYDLSINRCEDGSISNDCRLSPKPPYWHYLDNSYRTDLFKVMAKLNELKQNYEEFSSDNFEYNLNAAVKWYRYSTSEHHVVAIGNFDVQENNTNITFPTSGKWYEFFTRDSVEITSQQQSITLLPGEYRLYSTRQFNDPHVVTEIEEIAFRENNISVYPNPATSKVNISAQDEISAVELYSLSGKLMFCSAAVNTTLCEVNVENYQPGVYFVRIVQENNISTKKVLIK